MDIDPDTFTEKQNSPLIPLALLRFVALIYKTRGVYRPPPRFQKKMTWASDARAKAETAKLKDDPSFF